LTLQPELYEEIELKQARDPLLVQREKTLILKPRPSSLNLYTDLKKKFWWRHMKREITELVPRCLVCQKVKSEHRRPQGLVQPLNVPEWKLESISMDFIVGLPRTQKNNHMI